MRSVLLSRVLGALVAVAVGATACTSDTDTVAGPQATARAQSPATTPEPAARRSPSASATPVFSAEDEVLRVAVSEPATLDPMRIQDPASTLIARQLFEGLTRWDAVEEKVVPAAARSWKVSRGGKRFVFKLHEGMTFHDGSPVTAQDFRFAFDRIARKSNASDLAYTLEPIDGFVAVNQLGHQDHLAGIRVRNDHTLVIDLAEPYHEFPAVLTHPGLVPVQRKRVRNIDKFLLRPTGNGPFQLAQKWAAGRPVVMESFPGFLRTPELDGIVFVPYADAAASWIPFLREQVDVAEVPSGQFESARDQFGDAGFKPLLASYYFGVNVRTDPLDDPRLRRAISRAIDRRRIHETIYKGTMSMPRGIVPDGMPGFEQDLCLNVCRHSPDAARKLLAKVPKKKQTARIEYTKGRPHARVARLVERDLEAVGIKARTKGFGFSKYLRRLRDGDQRLYRLGWIAEYPSPDVFLGALFGSDSPDNHSGYRSKKVDRLLTKAKATRSEGKRVQLYKRAERLILRKMPAIPIGSFLMHWAMQRWVRDMHFDVMGGFDAVDVSVAR